MRGLLLLMYLALGILQTFAIFAGLTHGLGLDGMLALGIAPVAGYTPVVGTAAAFLGAMHGWGFDWFQAGTLFVGPFVLIVVSYLALQAAERPGAAQRRIAPKA